jgi:prophage regulatory protein
MHDAPPGFDSIFRRRTVLDLTGLSCANLYRFVRAGNFPRPVRLGKNSVGWRSSDVQAWIASRPEVDPDDRPATPNAKSRASSKNRKASRNARR